ncbi:MAG: hypothetical protein ACLTYN_10620 [Dysosmobacter welbionis]
MRLFALAAAVVMALGLTACGGSGSSEGRTGDTMETFFDFTVNSAYLTSDYAGRTLGRKRTAGGGHHRKEHLRAEHW